MAIIVLAVVLLLALIVVGAKSLLSVIVSDGSPAARPSSAASGGASPSASRVPTVQIVCRAEKCPIFVRVPGGDVLVDRDMTRGEQASYFEPELDVVLDDVGTVQVFENGTARPPGDPGERQSFSVKRDPDQ